MVTILESAGCNDFIEKENWQRLAVLAGKGMIDVIVVSGLSRLSYCPEEILQTMELLQSFQVQIDCIGYGISRLCQTETVFNAHLGETGTI